MNVDSVILNYKNKYDIQQLCAFPNKIKWKLKYRASRDGFSAKNFHEKIDGIKNTLTVIKSTSGNIFGGFANKSRTSINEYVHDPKAFIFSLVNSENNPFKVLCSDNGAYAIPCYQSDGPSFGDGPDIYIASGSNVQTCVCDFGVTYKHPGYQKGTMRSQTILAGSKYFQTRDIEIFIIDTNYDC